MSQKDESDRLVDKLVQCKLGIFLPSSLWEDPANLRPERVGVYADGWYKPMSIKDLKPEVAQAILADFAASVGMSAGS